MPHKDIELIYQNTAKVAEEEFGEGQELLRNYINSLVKVSKSTDYEASESSINFSLDENAKRILLNKIKDKKNRELKYVLVVGIGGSNLGTMALYRALRGRFDVFIHQEEPKLIFADTVSPPLISQIKDFLYNQITRPEELLIKL